MALAILAGIFLLIAIGGLAYGISQKRQDSDKYLKPFQDEVEKANKALEDKLGEANGRYTNTFQQESRVERAKSELRAAERRAEEDTSWVGFATFGVSGVIAIAILAFSSLYTQDVGEAKVQVSFTGDIQGQTTSEGLHFKYPWVDNKTFDTRNNLISYVGSVDEENTNYAGTERTGPHISFQDREGVSGDMDLTIRYSLDPQYVTQIYADYQNQQNLVSRVINEVARTVVREATTTRETIEVYNERGALALEIREGLENRINVEGFIIEDVAIQDIDYGADVRARFDEAQAARIEIDRAEAQQRAAEVQAETLVIEAQGRADANVTEAEGQAEANRLLSESLTDQILQQRWIDALDKGSVFVVEPPRSGNSLMSVVGKDSPKVCACGCGGSMAGFNSTRSLLPGHRRSRESLFWKYVDRGEADECWTWTGGTSNKGYGSFWDGERKVGAHVYSWDLHNEDGHGGHFVLHACDNPPCVNPSHLFLGTNGDNVKDMWKKDRGYSYFKERPPRNALGHALPRPEGSNPLVSVNP